MPTCHRSLGIILGAALCVLPMAALGHGSHDERIAELASDLAKRPDDAQLHFSIDLAALPNLERVSHAMSIFAERAHQALSRLTSSIASPNHP